MDTLLKHNVLPSNACSRPRRVVQAYTTPQLIHEGEEERKNKRNGKSKHVPDTCITLGKYTLPSILESILTPAHAVRYGSRATRIMQRFVVGEKYLTVQAIHYPTPVRRSCGYYRRGEGRGLDDGSTSTSCRPGRRTRKRSSDGAPACIPKIENNTLSESVEDALAVEFLI